MTLRLEWIDRSTARRQVVRNHYTRQLPAGGLLVYIGVWFGGEFWGSIVFGKGATPAYKYYFDLNSTQEVCELMRVALRNGHPFQTSKAVSIALKMLHKQSPGIRVCVSYADSSQGHIGSIYQAGNWTYLGESTSRSIIVREVPVHSKTIRTNYGTASIEWLRENVDSRARFSDAVVKYRYAYPFDEEMRSWLKARALPYPKRRQHGEHAIDSQSIDGGSNPTSALQFHTETDGCRADVSQP